MPKLAYAVLRLSGAYRCNLHVMKNRLLSFACRVFLLFVLPIGLHPFSVFAVGPTLRLSGAEKYFVGFEEVDGVAGKTSAVSRRALSDPVALTKFHTLVFPSAQLLAFKDRATGVGFRVPLVLTYDEYYHRRAEAQWRSLWRRSVEEHRKAGQADATQRSLLSLDLPVNLPSILGGGTPNFSITGSQRIELNMRSEWTDNQVSTATNRVSRFPALTMKQQQQFAISGTIGQKISVNLQQDSQAFSDLDNRISVRYEDRFDDGREGNSIFKKFEAGNVSLSLENAQFTGYTAQHSGLFGLKLESQIGAFRLTTVMSQEKGEGQAATFQAGAQESRQQIRDTDYRRGTYFFVDASYRKNFSRRDARGLHIAAADSIEIIRVFVADRSSQQNLANVRKGIAYLEPPISVGSGLPSLPDSSDFERGDYRELDFTEYYIDRNLGYIALNTPLQAGAALGVYYRTRNRNTGIRVEYGDVPDVNNQTTEAALRLLKTRQERVPDASVADDPAQWGVWQYEWRNVYFLGKTEINSEGFELRITKREAGKQEQDVDEQGRQYIQLLGLDRRGIDPGSPPDRLVDIDPELINFQRGELIFPDLYPFAPTLSAKDNGLAYPVTQESGITEQTPELYTRRSSEISTNFATFNRYNIEVEYRDRLAQYALGRSNIIENSEVVRLNGKSLQRGSDYIMLYEVGQIRFLNEAALDPNADVSVQYQFAPFFKPASNTLMGFQGRYELNSNSWMRGTVLYRSDKSLDQKSRVGRETGRYVLWDFDTRLAYKPAFLTSLVNLIPLVRTDAPSSLNISAELAQSIPDPNTRGDGFIDDFEGAKEETDLGVRRSVWTPSSPPLGRSHLTRGRMFWFNPQEQVDVREIYPTREVVLRDAIQHVLALRFDPRTPDLRWGGSGIDGPFVQEWGRSGSAALRARWGGIMRPLVGGNIDQTRSKFLEVWINGDRGEVHFDLGSISEDVNQNNEYDTEDDRSDGFGNDLIDPGEDTGVDGLADEEETGFDPVSLVSRPYDAVSNPDPHGDNFFFDGSPANNFEFDKVDYSRINGVEDNVNDGERGRRPNTEDINNSGFIDTQNDFFQYAIDLSPDSPDTALVAGGDRNRANWGNKRSWRMYRIPLTPHRLNTAYKGQTGSPSFSLIEMARIWVTDVEDSVALRIASIQIAGNKWQEDQRGALTDSVGTAISVASQIATGESFNVSVKNTYDNPGDYVSPPGAIVEFDRVTGVQNREQSLTLNYRNLQPGHLGQAFQTFFKDQDLTLYNKLKMFIYGSEDTGGDQSPHVFIRFGNGSTDYYEYRNNVVPGWDPQNHLEINFTDLTALKSETETARLQGTSVDTSFTVRFSDNAERQVFIHPGTAQGRKVAFVDFGDGRQYRVQGNPSLSRIRQITVGVANPYAYPLTKGEIWIDELRAANVRRDRGMAGRITVDADLADFASIRGSFQQVGSHYRQIGQPEAGSTSTFRDLGTDFQLERFFPKSWGLALPLRMRWTHDRRLPRLQVGSDIVLLRTDQREDQRTENNKRTFSIAYSKRQNSKNPFIHWTLERIRFNYSSSFDVRRSVTSVDTTASYQGAFSYDLSPKKQPAIPILKWAESSIVPKFISGLTFTPVPSQFQVDAQINRNRQGGTNRQFNQARRYRFIRNLSRNLRARMSPFKAGSVDYNLSITNDMRADSTIAIRKLKFGPETDYRQTFGFDVRPTISTWLQPGYQFSTSYQENRNPQLQLTGTSPKDRLISYGNRRSIRTTLNMDRLLTSLFGKPKTGGKKEEGPGIFVRGIRGFFGVLNPVNMNFSTDNNQSLYNVRTRPRASYRFGFSDEPRLIPAGPDTTVTGGNRVITIQQDRQQEAVNFDLDTGFKLISDLNISIRPSWRYSTTRTTNTHLEQRSRAWPETGIRWSPNIRKIGVVNKLFRRVDLSSGYARRVDRSKNLSLSSAGTGQIAETVTTSTNFSPLLGVTFDWNFGMSMRANYDRLNDLSRLGLSATDQKRIQRTLTVSLDYRISSGFRIPLFGRGKKLNGNLNLRTQFTRSLNETLISRNQNPFKPSNGQRQTAITMRSDYQFSRHVRGGLSFEWTNTRNTITKEKRLLRQGGFWTEFQFN